MKISGHLDLCGPALIEGWLHCDASPDEPIRLQVYVGATLLGECATDRFRQDLQDAGFGNGRCGFSFQIPEESGVTDFTSTRLRLVGSPVYLLPNEYTSIFRSLPDGDKAGAMPVKQPEPEQSTSDARPAKTYEITKLPRHGAGSRHDLSSRVS